MICHHVRVLLPFWFPHILINAFVKFFVIGHDCAHKSFSRNKLVEDIVGTLAFMPLIYPYEPWRFKHDRHHAKTNMYASTSFYNNLHDIP
jgi:fatty acid desaturase